MPKKKPSETIKAKERMKNNGCFWFFHKWSKWSKKITFGYQYRDCKQCGLHQVSRKVLL